MPFLVVKYFPRALPVFQGLYDLCGLRVLHLLPQILNHPVYILCVADTLGEALSTDHFGSKVVQLLDG